MSGRDLIIYFAIKHQGDWDKIYNEIKSHTAYNEAEMKAAMPEAPDCITILDKEYPKELKDSFKPPFVLFTKGNKSLLATPTLSKTVGVVGSRLNKVYLPAEVEEFGAGVSNGHVIVAPCSVGCPTQAVTGAIGAGGKAIVVMASGFNHCYPIANERLFKEIVDEGGLLVSEYPPNVAPAAANFPQSSRIVAALSKKILVVETKGHSGTETTIAFALQQGKDVYVMPTRATDPAFNNELIKEGAMVYTQPEDLD